MPACSRGCLFQLGLWAVCAGSFFFYLRFGLRIETAAWGVAAGAGLLAAMGLVLVGGISTALRERRMLMKAATGVTPADGAWLAVAGEIRSRSPIRAPMTGALVVGYEYKIFRHEGTGRHSGPATYFDGKALARGVIATRSGPVKLLAVPAFGDLDAEIADDRRAIANLKEHFRSSTFEQRDTAAQRVSGLEREWADDDGVFRIDRKFSTSEVDLSDRFHFEERQIRQGETVCAFGVYSRTAGGLVPDRRWGRQTRIMRGSAENVGEALRRRVARYAIGALTLISAALVIISLQ